MKIAAHTKTVLKRLPHQNVVVTVLYTYTTSCNIRNFYIFAIHTLWILYDPRMNSDYFPVQQYSVVCVMDAC